MGITRARLQCKHQYLNVLSKLKDADIGQRHLSNMENLIFIKGLTISYSVKLFSVDRVIVSTKAAKAEIFHFFEDSKTNKCSSKHQE